MTTPVLDINGLVLETATQQGISRPVNGIDLAIDPGEIVGLAGESGSGKSLTALTIAGLLPSGIRIRSGRVCFDGSDIVRMSTKAMRSLRGSGMVLVCQEPMSAFNPVLTIGQQMTRVIRRQRRVTDTQAQSMAIDWLTRVGIDRPQARLRMFPHELSGGILQRVMLAMAASCEPRLLIADEPTAAVDVSTQAELLLLLRKMRDELGTAILLISHDLGVVGDLCSRTLVMRAGRIVESAPTRSLLEAPTHPYVVQMLEALPVIGQKPLDARHNPEVTSGASTLLEVDNLKVQYPASSGPPHWAVDGVNLDLARGQALGLVGPSGCGKSTLARTLVGLHAPSGGQVCVDGRPITIKTRRDRFALARRIQIIFQDATGALSPRRTVAQILREPMDIHRLGDRAHRHEHAVELLERVGLSADVLQCYPHELSGGQRQRVSLARALTLKPDILIADEPVSALDVVVQDRILRLLDSIRRTFGTSILFISHDLAVVSRMCDRIAVMDHGRIVETGPADQVCSRPEHATTRGLLAAVPSLQRPSGPLAWDADVFNA